MYIVQYVAFLLYYQMIVETLLLQILLLLLFEIECNIASKSQLSSFQMQSTFLLGCLLITYMRLRIRIYSIYTFYSWEDSHSILPSFYCYGKKIDIIQHFHIVQDLRCLGTLQVVNKIGSKSRKIQKLKIQRIHSFEQQILE